MSQGSPVVARHRWHAIPLSTNLLWKPQHQVVRGMLEAVR